MVQTKFICHGQGRDAGGARLARAVRWRVDHIMCMISKGVSLESRLAQERSRGVAPEGISIPTTLQRSGA